ncbi:hypothetical protein CYMTET_23339 [Cymbomonas tetramitiformis]|uniref:Tyrosine-protein kinase ephrin type A/B receptor-like domain-containing protein n=1 Tax=Cymbomonas tetramitiformis TaxID=36881 RepID=A0AAE0L1D3_9CHLO|nr:hypothetical protein CYMTET_23339 [Cymbomonas tetramitiformis]
MARSVNCVQVLLILASHAFFPPSSAQSGPCSPVDYVPVYTECFTSETSARLRTLTYTKRDGASCEALSISGAKNVSCDCTPDDYIPIYEEIEGGCNLKYVPQACEGGTVSAPVEVDSSFCPGEEAKVQCTDEHIRSTYTHCDYHTDAAHPTIKVVYYYSDACNPALDNALLRLPPSDHIPCDLHCGPGYFLEGSKCSICPAGTYSVGGGLRLESFDDWDALEALGFQRECTYTNSSYESVPCDSWAPVSGSLQSKAETWLPHVDTRRALLKSG